MKLESEIQQLIRLEGMKHECNLMRNNSGALKDAEGRVVRFGLGNESKAQSEHFKSSDLVGITTVTITPDMVGMRVAIFTACEVKSEKWKFNGTPRERAQLNFLNFVRARGGFAGFANSIETFRNILRF